MLDFGRWGCVAEGILPQRVEAPVKLRLSSPLVKRGIISTRTTRRQRNPCSPSVLVIARLQVFQGFLSAGIAGHAIPRSFASFARLGRSVAYRKVRSLASTAVELQKQPSVQYMVIVIIHINLQLTKNIIMCLVWENQRALVVDDAPEHGR